MELEWNERLEKIPEVDIQDDEMKKRQSREERRRDQINGRSGRGLVLGGNGREKRGKRLMWSWW